eukprot:4097755-Pleurochrysis_carterae.AAC.2
MGEVVRIASRAGTEDTWFSSVCPRHEQEELHALRPDQLRLKTATIQPNLSSLVDYKPEFCSKQRYLQNSRIQIITN